jgi:hypothetical protein
MASRRLFAISEGMASPWVSELLGTRWQDTLSDLSLDVYAIHENEALNYLTSANALHHSKHVIWVKDLTSVIWSR